MAPFDGSFGVAPPASAPLPAAGWAGVFSARAAQRTLAADEALLHEGAPASHVALVVRGLLRCVRLTQDGRRHVCRFAGVGDVLGLGAARSYRYSAEAVTAARVALAPRTAIEGAGAPPVQAAVLAALTSELEHRERMQLRLSRMTAEERVADFLLELAERHPPASRGAAVRIAMARLDIGDYLGLTVETVSRTLRRFERDGLIALCGAHLFRLRLPGALRRLACGDRDGPTPQAA